MLLRTPQAARGDGDRFLHHCAGLLEVGQVPLTVFRLKVKQLTMTVLGNRLMLASLTYLSRATNTQGTVGQCTWSLCIFIENTL